MGLRIEHRQHKGLNNRAENSHQPTRRRERIMKPFPARAEVPVGSRSSRESLSSSLS
jgi:transposase-like protein